MSIKPNASDVEEINCLKGEKLGSSMMYRLLTPWTVFE